MPKGKYKIGPPLKRNKKGKCRVPGCKYYHYQLKDLQKHVEKSHLLTLAAHNKLPLSSFQHVTKTGQNSKYLKYRKVEYCLYRSCAFKLNPYSDLTKHLRKKHGLTRKQYEIQRNVLSSQGKQSVNNDDDSLSKSCQDKIEEQGQHVDSSESERERSILATSEDEAINGSDELFSSTNDEL